MTLPQRMPRPPRPADQARHTDALHGKVLPVNFWATTCATRIRDMPALVALQVPVEALLAERPAAA